MSHFTKIQTKITQRKHLLLALDDLNQVYNYDVVQGTVRAPVMVRGYNGQKIPCEIKLDLHNKGYDIGFQKEREAYAMVADWWSGGPLASFNKEEFRQRVEQRYGYHAIMEKAKEENWSVQSEETLEQGEIRICVRRIA